MPDLSLLDLRIQNLEKDFEEFKKEAKEKFKKNDTEHTGMKEQINGTHTDVREMKLILQQMKENAERSDKKIHEKIDELKSTTEKNQRWGSIVEKILIAIISVCGALAGLWAVLKTIGIL